jgi:hypothetical protein
MPDIETQNLIDAQNSMGAFGDAYAQEQANQPMPLSTPQGDVPAIDQLLNSREGQYEQQIYQDNQSKGETGPMFITSDNPQQPSMVPRGVEIYPQADGTYVAYGDNQKSYLSTPEGKFEEAIYKEINSQRQPQLTEFQKSSEGQLGTQMYEANKGADKYIDQMNSNGLLIGADPYFSMVRQNKENQLQQNQVLLAESEKRSLMQNNPFAAKDNGVDFDNPSVKYYTNQTRERSGFDNIKDKVQEFQSNIGNRLTSQSRKETYSR